MRPLRLELEGFTSFRERVELDFDGLDLFAITGPTGAGKSSLIDGLVFALYGQVPRVGRSYKQLISHGAERLSAGLDFEVGGTRYRIARSVRERGTPAVRLERLEADGPVPIADRVKEIEREVERIVGLDYDAFTRSVVLPQGQFDAFLKGEPEERRKILVALLDLGVYGRMHQIVNTRANAAKAEAAGIANLLETDYAEATPDTLEARRGEHAAAKRDAARLMKEMAALEEGLELARGVREARREAQRLGEELEKVRTERRQAEETLSKAERGAAELQTVVKELTARLEGTGMDAERPLQLAGALPVAKRLAEARRRHEQRRERLERVRTDLAAAPEARDGGDAELESAEKAAAEAEAAETEARAELERRRDVHAAHALRADLRPGEPCPVCERTVERVPEGAAPALDEAQAALKRAEADTRRARERRDAAAGTRQQRHAAADAAARALEEAVAAEADAVRDREEVESALRGAGYEGDALDDPAALVASLESELARLEQARSERRDLEARREEAAREAQRLASDLAVAASRVETGTRRSAALGSEHGAAQSELDGRLEKLAERARRAGWEGLEEAEGERDEAAVLEWKRRQTEAERSDTAGRAGRLEGEVERLEKDVERAAELRAKREQLEDDAALNRTLAQHLQANQFLAFVQEEALRVLAEDGSRHLEALSQGRYSLETRAQDFEVIDHWNADRQRSVKTLSGGESFLASLALALALAERLADLSARGRAGEALESLFLDEGFGSLDPEALDLVLQAIEALQGGDRVVGVVTHIQPLAERLPARVEVRREPGGTARLERA